MRDQSEGAAAHLQAVLPPGGPVRCPGAPPRLQRGEPVGPAPHGAADEGEGEPGDLRAGVTAGCRQRRRPERIGRGQSS